MEPRIQGTYVTYPYLRYHYDRALGYIAYLITTRTNTEFLRMLLLVA